MSDLLKSVTEIDDIDFLFPKCKPKSHSQREEILNENYDFSTDNNSARIPCDENLNTDECTDNLLHTNNLNCLKNKRYSDSVCNEDQKLVEICKIDQCDRVRKKRNSVCNNKRRCQHNHNHCGTYDLSQARKYKRKHKSNETLDTENSTSLMIPFTKMEYDSSVGGDEDSGQFENSGSNGSSSTTFSETNIPFSAGVLRDSRIEIAGGREIFSQNKIRVGGRSRWKGNTAITASERESDLLECTSSSVHGNIKPKRKCSSKSHGSNCCINPESPSVWEIQQTRGKNHYNYIECCNHDTRDLHLPNYAENEPGDCTHERSYHSCHCAYVPHQHLMEEFSPCGKGLHHQRLLEREYSVPIVHGARKAANSLVTLKETVFGSEVTSIEKPLPFRVEQLNFKGQGISTSESSSQTSIPPYFYGCRSPTEGEVVFDDIEEWERVREIEDFTEQEFLMHPKYTVPLQPVKLNQSTSNCARNKVSKSSNVDAPGLAEGNSSPSGYESDECERSISQHNLKSAQLCKQLIGNLPIAEYEGSPKRYGLSKTVPCGERVEGLRTNPKDNLSILDLTTDQPQNISNNSEVNIFASLPRSVPGFPQRVIGRRRKKSIEKDSHNTSGINQNLSNTGQQTMEEMPISLKTNSKEYILTSQQESLSCESTPIKSSLIENRDIADPLYEFSETRKVLEEFFQPLPPQTVPESQSADFDELEYTLKRQSGNSYVGHRLATDVESELKSPKKSPNDDKGEGSSPKLISFTEESNLSDESAFRSLNQNVNEIREELACHNKVRGNTEEVLVEQTQNTNRKFTMSPESTDCDSNELESEVSLDYEVSVHSSSRLGQVMPILEDGLSSGNVSETDDMAKHNKPLEHWKNSGSGESEVNKSEVGDGNANSLMKKQVSEIEQDIQVKTVEPKLDELGNPSNHSLSTLQLTSDPRFELDFKETLRQTENQDGSTSNGVFDSNDPELEALDPMRPTPPPSPAPGPGYKLPSNCKPVALSSQYAVDSNNVGTNSGLSASLESHLSSFSGLQLSSFTQQYSTKLGLNEQEQSFNSCSVAHTRPYNTTTKFSSNPNAIPNLMSSNLDYLSLNDSQLCSSNEDLTSHERTSSPVWIPRRPLLRRSDNNGRHGDTTYGVRDPLIRKSARYTELVEDENDTDQETDRLLGQHRTEDDCGFYDENEWKDNSRHSLHSCTASKSISSFIKPSNMNNRQQPTATPRLSLNSTSPNGLNLNSPTAEQAYDENDCLSSCPNKSMKDKDVIKKKRNKEELKNNPSVLIEGVLFRARYLGSTQLVTEGQPTKATRMLQAEEAVSRIKPLKNQNGLNSASPTCHISSGNNNQSPPKYIDLFHATNNHANIHPIPIKHEESPVRTLKTEEKCICAPLHLKPFFGRYVSNDLIGFDNCDESLQSPNVELEKSRNSFCSEKCDTFNEFNIDQTKRLSLVTIRPTTPPPSSCSAITGTLFHLRYLGSIEVDETRDPGSQQRKKPKKTMVEEAVATLKAPEGESQPSTEVDLFISTEKIMVLNTDLKEIMIDNTLRTISYIADIGDLVVLMARRRIVPSDSQEDTNKIPRPPKMICHVFESEEAQYIAQSIGQAFQVAYMEFLKANGIEDHSFVREMDYQEVLNSQEIFGDELQMFAKKERQKDVVVPKAKGEILGVVIVESGWGSMLPTVVIANLAPAGAAARCGQLNIGDQIIAINGVSLVGLPLSTCQTYIKNSKNQTVVKLTVVPCPPVVEVKIKRPDTKYQLGFSVQNGVICSLLRGGIAERGGVRVGHRIIEINNQSVVAVPHEKIVNLLATSVGEINMKTMPTSMFRLLTGQETPLHI